MGIVIRVLYNNQNWQSPCRSPAMDSLCQKCLREDNNLNIIRPSENDRVCSGLCWERDLCNNHEWGSARKIGNRAYKGAKVFFVFQQPDGKYTLWARTTVDSTNVSPRRQLTDHEVGYRFWMRFSPFKPLPQDKWVKDLRDIDLVGEQWKQGRYRFITTDKETQLERLIDGVVPGKLAESPAVVLSARETVISVNLASTIYSRLQRAAAYEGRQPEEIIKEAVAEWLRSRGA